MTYKINQKLLDACQELFDVHPRDLVSDARFGFLMPARFALYKSMHMRGLAYAEIGRRCGNRDHSTIIHGVRRADYFMERDPEYARKVNVLATLNLLPPPLPEGLADKYMPVEEEEEGWYND